MYDCAARVQEIIDLTPAMIRLTKPYTIKVIGKGNKPRITVNGETGYPFETILGRE